jgi:hypothetical protein
MIRYVTGSAALGENFYGYGHELSVISNNRLVWVCGQRRMGKTSLLCRVKDQAREQGWQPLFLDFTELPPEKPDGRKLLLSFLDSNKPELEKCGLKKANFNRMDPVRGFRHLLARVLEQAPGAIFLWDEAEQRLIDVEANDKGFLDDLAAGLVKETKEARKENCFHWVVGATQFVSKLSEQGSQFLLEPRFLWLPLPGLGEQDAAALLGCGQTGGWTSPLPEGVVAEAVRWSGGHPNLLQELGARLAERTRYEGARVDSKLLRACCDEVRAAPYYQKTFSDDYAKLTPTQQAVLAAVCRSSGELALPQICTETGCGLQEVQWALLSLSSYGYVYSADGVARLRFLFYRDFIPDRPPPSQTGEKALSQLRAPPPPPGAKMGKPGGPPRPPG